MIRILANDGIENSARLSLEQQGFEVVTTHFTPDTLAQHINEFDVLTVRSTTKVRSPLLDTMTRTRLIIRGGVGLDNIDVAHAQSKGIVVRNTPRSSSLSVAELVFAHLSGMVRFLYDANRQMPKEGMTRFNELKKQYASGTELRGKTLGLLGFGNIGQEVAKIALGVGMNVKAFDPFVTEKELVLEIAGETLRIPFKTSTKEEVIRQSDFISLHASGNTELLTDEDFVVMKTGVGIINCARGGVIREQVLLGQLRSGKVSCAALDVFEQEPTGNLELLQHPKISLTPHIGASTLEAQDRIGKEIVEIITSFGF